MTRMKISLGLASVVTAVVACVAALSLGGACTTTPTVDPTDCTVSHSTDAGTTGSACALEYSCNSDTQHYWLSCNASGSNFACVCGTDQSDLDSTINVQPFICTGPGALPAVNQGCEWTLALASE
jgi:hypothetical protein